MAKEKRQRITLDTMIDGQVHKEIETGFDQIVANIMDDETEAEATRKLIVEIQITPNKDDRLDLVAVAKVTTKLAGRVKMGSLQISQIDGELAIIDPQLKLPLGEKSA